MLRTRSVAVATAFALTVAAAGGCGRLYQRPQPTGADAPCSGQRYLEVENSFQTSVDLYGYFGLSSAPRYLGSVPPGIQRVILVEPVGVVYGEIDGRRISSRAGRGGTGSISVAHRCEERD
jgi:hypothetical protein